MARPSWDEYFREIARVTAKRASCPRKSVGAVIVNTETHHIVATGYNGSLPGQPHCLDEGCLLKDGHCTRSRHAEVNACDQLALEWWELDSDNEPVGKGKLKAYVTLQPCKNCLKTMESFGIYDIDYMEEYPHG
jgi:dCMP deaminase